MVFGKMSIHPLYKTKLTELSHILLSLLILSINMNGPDFFRTKEIFFFLFVLVSLPYGNYRRVFDFLLIFSIFGEFFFKYYCIFGAYLLQYMRKTRYAGTHGFFANRQGSKSDP